MILKSVASPSIFHKVRQLESFSKTTLFANSCKLLQFTRKSSNFAIFKQCLNSSLNKNERQLLKFPTNTIILNTEITRKTSTTASDHVRMWILEKIASAALPVIIPVALTMENVICDGLMSLLIVIHMHWGLEAIITDYARPRVVGPLLPKLLHLSLIFLSAITLCGLFLLINNGPGVSKAIKEAWAIGKEPPPNDDSNPNE
ncbi:succinate dehydrogenase [ubiquinone] cytochrome b small subunit, mitochondrial [Apis mellifera caucasica]|uniref:Succinate dehydrogenase [ubiquinone] cytochrome b small subunit n=1 Tax=Apis mellifera TaxID=7460 RepID=A0A7M7FYR6_APIME|nr:succinate dehydrogenase [ubiquinone] cytochrome b small subunit, mitochondrial [Apis mellifera]KAG6796416.1 succinate dehydrogenase [ubiquinone] cytochrome b small subunit, mitochondrial [Apis mellifera caucasica]KAG9428107.1 succinate dehydrogenase [ubiquinone] cytochrome b small subunit, mitochondrial [Apis mellifera carnica]|eukprot:XP_001120412.2 succinate dehydrogenase [ubiquinone] cytochrome b small subunit, mitochondrial [Apis mellifera]